MVERLDGEDEQPQHNFESRESIGLDGIQIELQDFKNTEFPKPKDTVAAGESEDNFVIYGKIGTREVARKLNVPQQWQRSTQPATGDSSFIKWCPVFNPQNLQPFFDVSSKEIAMRLGHSLIPLNPKFHAIFHAKPDLYGPFWILTTLVASLFIAGNLSHYIQVGKKNFQYNFTVIPVATGIVYGVGLGLPLLVHSLQKWFGNNLGKTTPLSSAIGIYGYSFSSFVLVTVLCAIPANWLQWLLVVYAAVTSVGFLVRTYWQEFSDNLEPRYRWIGIALVSAVQLTLLLVFKLYFFRHFKAPLQITNTALPTQAAEPVPVADPGN